MSPGTPRRIALALASLGLTAGCGTEELVTLGRAAALDAAPQASMNTASFDFATPVLVAELFSETKDDNPTLTWDMKEIYYSTKRDGENTDVWWASRASADEPFGEPELLAPFSSEGFDTSPAVDGDGLTFWVAQAVDDSDTALDILKAERPNREAAWGALELVPELNSDADDIPRPTGAHGLIMPLSSRREGDGYLTFTAERPSASEPFTEPQVLNEPVGAGVNTADAFLSDDGLTLLYNQVGSDETGDLFVATRQRRDEPFAQAAALTTINTAADERDPWLSRDGATLYFSSDRSGSLAIYVAARVQ
jgi:WD40-like Beta Propeller Repeat